MKQPRLKLVLEIDPTADPVAGTLCESSGPVRTFTGWTQLGHALDTAITVAASAHTYQDTPEETR